METLKSYETFVKLAKILRTVRYHSEYKNHNSTYRIMPFAEVILDNTSSL